MIKKLKDICDITIGRTPPRNEKHWFSVSEGIPWISIKDMGNANKYITTSKEYLTHEAVRKFKIPIVKKNTIILSFKMTVGKVLFVTQDMVTNEAIAHLNNCKINSDYLYYFLKNFNFNSLPSTSSIVKLAVNSKIIKEIPINIPNSNKQKKISEILSTLDKKIELNQKMNRTLEEIIKIIFKSWFINFELSEISKGLRAGSLGDIIFRSKDRIGKMESKILAAVSSGELIPSEEYFSKKVFSNNTEKYLKVGRYDFAYNPSRINIGSIGMNKNSFIGAVSPIYNVFKVKKSWHWFIEQFIRLKSTNSKIKQLSSGSVRQSLSFEDFASIPLTIPTETSLQQFNKIYEIFRRKIIQNKNECKVLNSLMNILLPKLISGELTIPYEEKMNKYIGV